MDVVLIPGDGIGKEISESVKTVSDALKCDIKWIEYKAGADYYASDNKLMEDGLLEEIARCHIALKGPTATPIGTGFRSINVYLRQNFNTYANVRPVSTFEGVASRYEDVDLVIIRENTEDLYKGIEDMLDEDTAHGLKIITRQASERIIRYAFEYARKNGRKKVTCVHKANIMKLTDGLFLDCFTKISKEYPDIMNDSVIIDALCMKLVSDPCQYDVLVAPNLYGDIISDLCAGLVGGLGFAPSANIGDNVRIYEAVHGSAPDIAGKGIANPSAILLALAMLLKDNGMSDKASVLEKAIRDCIKDGIKTKDVGGNCSTAEFTAAIRERIENEAL
ncbi:MAG: isocitrate/isopropylmalate dehydrogenase family protein [Erysipelotrichaceae bacterium]|nr:isocitrate/isopropylmalate dehydrogenase family protein [Erysipelotrichaceae bacterium]